MIQLASDLFASKQSPSDFNQTGKLRLNNVWQPDSAQRITAAISRTPFNMAFNTGTGHKEASEAQLSQLGSTQQQQLLQEIYASAGHGQGFLYGRYKLTPDAPDSDLTSVLRVLNDKPMLDFVRTMTGNDKITEADAQVTRFTSGNFLTRHSDDVKAEGRKVAYVLGFTERWHPDWGGLLQFYQKDGTPTDAWAPSFNSITLFDVRHIHAVTCIAPYAPVPRYSITGWFKESVTT